MSHELSLNERREFLKKGLTIATGSVAATAVFNQAIANLCGLTPDQTAGPFYPGDENIPNENDLTFVKGRSKQAAGQIVYIKGTVTDQNCRPIKDANVEIWQACVSGKYNSRKDPNPAPLDPNFKYWGETFTNELGQYQFKTIIPGAYPAAEGWSRPPHIHFRVARLGFKELITQMYFKGDKLNDKDLILLDIPEHERERVIVDFKKAPDDGIHQPGSLIGIFDISIQTVR